MKIRGIILLLLATVTLSAQSVRTKELEMQRKKLTEEIKNTSKLLIDNEKSIHNLLDNLELITLQINARKQLLGVLEKEIDVLNEEIQTKEIQIKKLDKDLQYKKENYVVSLRKMYKQKNNQDQLLYVLSADHLAQSFRRMLYLKEYTNWRKKQSNEIIAFQNKITAEQRNLLNSKQEKETLVSAKKKEEDRLHQEEDTQKAKVSNLQKNSKNLQVEINKKQKKAESLDREIAKIIAEEVAIAKKAAKADPKVERKAETKGGYAMTKEERSLSADFAGNKGQLPFPVQGNSKIINRFGLHQYGNLKNTLYNNNGIEIKTTPGNNARAVFNGTVTGVYRVPGFQNPVIILRHGNYLTLYAFFDQVFVKQGDIVKTGQEIGKIYTDRDDNDLTILHFEIWKEETKLNPEPWLKK